MVVVDTNILTDHLRADNSTLYKQGNSHLQNFFKFYNTKNNQIAISQVTIQGLYAGRSMNDEKIELKVLNLLQCFTILPYKYEISVLAGKIMQSNTITFTDSVIASTCLFYNASLITLNSKHFKDIDGLVLLDPKKV